MVKQRQSLEHTRQSRDRLRQSFEGTIKNMEATVQSVRTGSLKELQRIEQLLCQKEIQMQQMHVQHATEIEKFNRKLYRRDETLKKVLLNKVKSMKT